MSWTSCKKCEAGLEQYDVYCWKCGAKQDNVEEIPSKIDKNAEESIK